MWWLGFVYLSKGIISQNANFVKHASLDLIVKYDSYSLHKDNTGAPG